MKPDEEELTPENNLEKVFNGDSVNWAKVGKIDVPYNRRFCQKLIQFFNKGIGEWTEGHLGTKSFKANPLPHFSAFARSIGTNEKTLHKWAGIFPEWKIAMQMAEDMRNEILKDNSLLGNYDSGVARLFLGHYAGIKEKAEPAQPAGLPVVFVNGFNHFLAQRGEAPIKLPGIEDAEIIEPKAKPKVSDMGQDFKDFSEKRRQD